MCRFADGIKASPASRRVLASGYFQTRSIVATTSARNQISEPRRLDAESSPSLNGEGSTVRRAVLSLPNPQASQAQGLTYALHAPNVEFGLEYREGALYWYANGGAIDP